MARPKKDNAEYFSHVSKMRNDVKVKALRRKFSHTGYAVWNYLLEVLTDADGFSIKWDELNIELYAADFDLEVPELKDIVDYCVKLGLLQQEDNVLMCDNLTKSFTNLLGRRVQNKGVSAAETPKKQSFCSRNSAETPENDSFCSENSAETPKINTETRQSSAETPIVKYSKVKKSKEEKSIKDSSSQCCSEENEQEKAFYKHFFFRNLKRPKDETARFIAWNQRRGWKGNDGKEANTLEDRMMLARMWTAKEAGPRCSDKFLKSWSALYSVINGSDIAELMLDERCNGGYRNNAFIIQCPSGMWPFLRGNVDLLRALFPWVETKYGFDVASP